MPSSFAVMLSAAIIAIVLIGGTAVLISTVCRSGRLGANLQRVVCPRCAQPQPLFRVPTSVRQAMSGGWTCRSGGTEIDKWGHTIASRSRA